jgi:hypothetical protein
MCILDRFGGDGWTGMLAYGMLLSGGGRGFDARVKTTRNDSDVMPLRDGPTHPASGEAAAPAIAAEGANHANL